MAFLDLTAWPLWAVLAVFLACALIIGVAGTQLARVADRLADLTGLGEAIFGAVLLGGSTSLSGTVTSMATAWRGYPELAVSNAVGGIAVQTVFLVVADVFYRRANLEHAAASLENMMQGALLMTLLSIPLLAAFTPSVVIWEMHPASLVLLTGYIYGLYLIKETRGTPLWYPRYTDATRSDQPQGERREDPGLVRSWAVFIGLGAVMALAGYLVGHTGIALVEETPLSATVVGVLLTATATSLPELVTAVAAVRHGALTLAVGGIIGGNTFDVLFLVLSDASYREGSIYHAITNQQFFFIALNVLLTGIILLGLLRREKKGFAGIGFESLLVLVLYIVAIVIVLGGG